MQKASKFVAAFAIAAMTLTAFAAPASAAKKTEF